MKARFFSSKFKFKYLLASTTLCAVGHTYYVYNSPSNYQIACNNLGFGDLTKQASLLNIMHMSQHLKPPELWKSIYRSKTFENPEKVFNDFLKILNKNKAYSSNIKDFNAINAASFLGGKSKPYLWDYFTTKGTKNIDDSQIAKFIVDSFQSFFGRKETEERNVLQTKNWMNESEQFFFEEAEKLGIINEIPPDYQKEYQAIYILGATRVGMILRLLEIAYYIQQGMQIKGEICFITGDRPAKPSMDGMSKETKKILEELQPGSVSISNINLGNRGTKEERQAVAEQYLENLALKIGEDVDNLTEKNIAEDIIESYMNDLSLQIRIINTPCENGKRPTTLTTGITTAKDFIQQIKDNKYSDTKNFDIAVVSNNPFIPRQESEIQLVFTQELNFQQLEDYFTIKIHGIGFTNKLKLVQCVSALASLIYVKHQLAYPEEDISSLMFSKRTDDLKIPKMPDIDCLGLEEEDSII